MVVNLCAVEESYTYSSARHFLVYEACELVSKTCQVKLDADRASLSRPIKRVATSLNWHSAPATLLNSIARQN